MRVKLGVGPFCPKLCATYIVHLPKPQPQISTRYHVLWPFAHHSFPFDTHGSLCRRLRRFTLDLVVHTVEPTLKNRIITTDCSQALYADKGYDSKKIRNMIRQYGNVDRVGKRGTIVHRVVNRRRNIVERFFSWLDKNRRLNLRYDALITSYESWTWLASVRLINL